MLVWGLGKRFHFTGVREFSTFTQFQFSDKASGSQLPITPAVVDLKPSSILCGHWAQVLNVHIATYTHTHRHISKLNWKYAFVSRGFKSSALTQKYMLIYCALGHRMSLPFNKKKWLQNGFWSPWITFCNISEVGVIFCFPI